MTSTLNLIASSGLEVEWSRPLMIGWIAIVLALSVIEVFTLTRGFLDEVSTGSGSDLVNDQRVTSIA